MSRRTHKSKRTRFSTDAATTACSLSPSVPSSSTMKSAATARAASRALAALQKLADGGAWQLVATVRVWKTAGLVPSSSHHSAQRPARLLDHRLCPWLFVEPDGHNCLRETARGTAPLRAQIQRHSVFLGTETHAGSAKGKSRRGCSGWEKAKGRSCFTVTHTPASCMVDEEHYGCVVHEGYMCRSCCDMHQK